MEQQSPTKSDNRRAKHISPPGQESMPDSEQGVARPWQVFAIVCVGITLANMDLFSVNIALPRIADEFVGASLEDLSWILNAYAIAYAALLVFFGRLAEGFRRDRSFILGIGVFAIAAAACAFATSVWQLVALRVVAAAGAALMTPTSLGLLLASFAPERRGAAVRNWAAIGGFAAALGPLVGGLLVSISWRWIFVVNAIIGAAAMIVAWRTLPHVPGHDVRRPSLIAALLITGGISALIFAIVKVNAWGWSALQAGLAIIPGPLLVPFTSLLFTSRLIARFGAAAVVVAGTAFVVVGFAFWATFLSIEPNATLVVIGMALNGIGVGLTFPTLMGVSTHALPPSSFATGSGMINMLRQAAIAIGVAIFVAIIGTPESVQERLAAYQIGWWVMATLTLLTLVPTLIFLRPARDPAGTPRHT